MTPKENYEGILLEEIRDSIKVLAEGQIGIREDVSTLKNDLVEFKDDTKNNFKIMTDYLMKIEDEITAIKEEIAGIKDGSIPVSNMVDVEKRVAFLEQEVAELKTV